LSLTPFPAISCDPISLCHFPDPISLHFPFPSVKNIGKPCTGEPHARFDEGGQARACSLLYPFSVFLDPVFLRFPCGFEARLVETIGENAGTRAVQLEPHCQAITTSAQGDLG